MSSNSSSTTTPAHGLSYPQGFLQSLPILLSRPAPHAPIRAITAAQFAQIQSLAAFADPEDSVLFPFLHGLEGNNLSQNSFFAQSQRATSLLSHAFFPSPNPLVTIPKYRGLVWVRADDQPYNTEHSYSPMSPHKHELDHSSDDEDSDGLFEDDIEGDTAGSAYKTLHSRRLSHASSLSSFDSPMSTISASTAPTSLVSPSPSFLQCPPATTAAPAPYRAPTPPGPSNLLLSTFSADLLLMNTSDGPQFIPPRVPDGISLRNFGIQTPIYATLSDIVVYSPNGLTRQAFMLAERFKHAIEAKQRERERLGSKDLVSYNVFVVTDSFSEFESHFPHLVAFDSKGRATNHVDFAFREREEMCNFTKATEVMDGLWLGNTSDVPLQNSLLIDDPFEGGGSSNPLGFDICIECVDGAHFPSSTELNYIEQHFAKFEELWAENCHLALLAGNLDPAAPLPSRPAPSAKHIIHLAFPSSPGSSQYAINHMMAFISFLQRLLYPNPIQSSASSVPQTQSNRSSSSFYKGSANLSGSPITHKSPQGTETGKSEFENDADSRLQVPPPRKCKILLFSSDGYTETSVLALSMLMAPKPSHYHPTHPSVASVLGASTDTISHGPFRHSQPKVRPGISRLPSSQSTVYGNGSKLTGMSLPEAYLELQIAKERSFFVYPNDLEFLKKMESKLSTLSKDMLRERSREREMDHKIMARGVSVDSLAEDADTESNRNWKWSTWAGTRTGSLSIPSSPAINEDEATSSYLGATSSANSMLSVSNPGTAPPMIAHKKRARASTSPMPTVLADHWAWFSDPRFDGSFPSRVLPFLYLGNLAHASNAYMLHALGITHVVSVGECALVPPSTNRMCQAAEYRFSYGGKVLGAGPGSLWMEEREGRIQVLDIKGVSDDGIDSLRPRFREVCDWIDAARQQGGKVLVHCRVGVSRSATITIAYVMKHLGLSLVDAYLLVRSRRLSVLIQPNLRLLFNLCSWEVELARDYDDEEKRAAFLSRRLSWPYLSREVHILNEKYIM